MSAFTEPCWQCADDCGQPPAAWVCDQCANAYCNECLGDHDCVCGYCGGPAHMDGCCYACLEEVR